jgi:hypothetical protein
MFEASTTPTIEMRIGRQTRRYHAFITTAPAVLDAPSTLTLYAGPLKDIASLALGDLPADVASADIPSRLVLVDTTELVWQRDRCRAQGYLLTPADSVVVGTTLQLWLLHRLRSPARRTPDDRRCTVGSANAGNNDHPLTAYRRVARVRGCGERLHERRTRPAARRRSPVRQSPDGRRQPTDLRTHRDAASVGWRRFAHAVVTTVRRPVRGPSKCGRPRRLHCRENGGRLH